MEEGEGEGEGEGDNDSKMHQFHKETQPSDGRQFRTSYSYYTVTQTKPLF